MRSRTHLLVVSICSLVACTSAPPQDGRDDDFTGDGKADNAIAEGSTEARAILVVANTATSDELTRQLPAGVGLSQQTADSILAYRAGADGQAGTADDEKIDTLAELDSVQYVGPIAFDALLAFTAPTALRVDSVSLMDPHIFAQVFFCSDVTSRVNDTLAQKLAGDEDGDGFLDLSLMSVFRPFRQDAVATSADIGVAHCTASSPTSCSPDNSTAATVATNRETGTCLGALSGTTSNYDPAIVTTSGPCFATNATTITIPIAGIDLALADAKVAARYQNGRLVKGLIRGFVSEEEANSAILPDNLPVVGGKPLSSVLAGGAGSCASGDDRDQGPGGARGWYLYLNFTATKVKLDATP
jgi:hypothetical protein